MRSTLAGVGALALLLGGTAATPARADQAPAAEPARALQLRWQPPQINAGPSALQGVSVPQGESAEDQTPVTSRWWFWAAVGGVVATTVLVLVLTNKEESAPSTTLGNMEGFRGK